MNPKPFLWSVTIALVLALGGLTHAGWRIWQESAPTRAAAAPNYTVDVFDIGQGDAIFIEEADGTQILVDGGPNDLILSRLGSVMRPWDRHIDYIVATHPHADHITGLIHVLERYDVSHVVLSDIAYDSMVYDYFLDMVDLEGARILRPSETDRLTDMTDILYPSAEVPLVDDDNVNEASIILEVFDGNTRALLTGDAGEPVEEALLAAGALQDIDVLKLGHHGSKDSSTRAFLAVTQPEHVVISVGEENDYHHPHLSVLSRLNAIGTEIFRTDLQGTIRVESTNTALNIKEGR